MECKYLTCCSRDRCASVKVASFADKNHEQRLSLDLRYANCSATNRTPRESCEFHFCVGQLTVLLRAASYGRCQGVESWTRSTDHEIAICKFAPRNHRKVSPRFAQLLRRALIQGGASEHSRHLIKMVTVQGVAQNG